MLVSIVDELINGNRDGLGWLTLKLSGLDLSLGEMSELSPVGLK